MARWGRPCSRTERSASVRLPSAPASEPDRLLLIHRRNFLQPCASASPVWLAVVALEAPPAWSWPGATSEPALRNQYSTLRLPKQLLTTQNLRLFAAKHPYFGQTTTKADLVAWPRPAGYGWSGSV